MSIFQICRVRVIMKLLELSRDEGKELLTVSRDERRELLTVSRDEGKELLTVSRDVFSTRNRCFS